MDPIDRKEAAKKIAEEHTTVSQHCTIDECRAYNDGINAALCALETVKEADAEPVRHGCWKHKAWHRFGVRKVMVGTVTISAPDDREEDLLVCSVCGKNNRAGMETEYCPWCGAKIDEKVEG